MAAPSLYEAWDDAKLVMAHRDGGSCHGVGSALNARDVLPAGCDKPARDRPRARRLIRTRFNTGSSTGE